MKEKIAEIAYGLSYTKLHTWQKRTVNALLALFTASQAEQTQQAKEAYNKFYKEYYDKQLQAMREALKLGIVALKQLEKYDALAETEGFALTAMERAIALKGGKYGD